MTVTRESEALERLHHMEERYTEACALMDQTEGALASIETLDQTMIPLMGQYSSSWMNDRKVAIEAGERLGVIDEDEVWNLYSRQCALMAKLLADSSRFFTNDLLGD